MKAHFCLQCGARLEEESCDGVIRSKCPACHRVHFEDPKVATGCLIFNESNEVLLVKRSIDPVGKWVFPGGYVDRFEDPRPSACREVEEETGLLVDTQELIDIYRAPDSPVLVIVYFAHVKSESPPAQALHECQDVAYFSRERVPWTELAFSITKRALEEGFKRRVNP